MSFRRTLAEWRIKRDSVVLKKYFYVSLVLVVICTAMIIIFSLPIFLFFFLVIFLALNYVGLTLRIDMYKKALTLFPDAEPGKELSKSNKNKKMYELADLKKKGYDDEKIIAEAKTYGISVLRMRAVLRNKKYPWIAKAVIISLVIIIVLIVIFYLALYDM